MLCLTLLVLPSNISFVPSDNIVCNTVKLSAKNWLVNTAVFECNIISVATI